MPASLPTRRTLAWIPLALVVLALLVSAITGRGFQLSSASAATTVDVTGVVSGDVFIDASACAAASVDIGELVAADPWKTAQDSGGGVCSIDFGSTNHGLGTTLSMLEDPAAPVSPADAMKCVAGSCSGTAIADYQGGAEPSPGTSAFGAQLLSAGGLAAGVWGTSGSVHDVQDTGDTACQTSAAGTGTCGFTFGATVGSSDGVGTYRAQAQLLVLAR